jgi:hypothetical protein
MSDPNQPNNDILYLAKRQKIIEDAVIRLEDALLALNKDISEWTTFVNSELFKQGVTIHKNKKRFEYFRSALKETHKQNYEKFESLFRKIALLFDKKKKGSKGINTVKSIE